MKIEPLLQEVQQAIEPSIQSRGLELIDMEYKREAQGWVLRIFLRPGRGNHGRGMRRSKQGLSAILEVRDLIPNRYVLEVSSPG